jgi:hypothetical protein
LGEWSVAYRRAHANTATVILRMRTTMRFPARPTANSCGVVRGVAHGQSGMLPFFTMTMIRNPTRLHTTLSLYIALAFKSSFCGIMTEFWMSGTAVLVRAPDRIG